MSQRDAQYLCDRTRFHTGVFDRSLLRDGFSADRGEADRDILSALNDIIRLSAMTGQFVCTFTLELTEDVSSYAKDPDMGLIKAVTYDDIPIEPFSIIERNNNSRAWQTAITSGTPVRYSTDIPDVILLDPPPDTTDDAGEPSLKILAETVADDLEEPDDVPSRIPAAYHEGLCYGAAILILSSMGGDEQRIATLSPIWKKYLDRMQEQAQRSEYGDTEQIVPMAYRTHRKSF